MQDMMSSATSTMAQVTKRTHFNKANIKDTSTSRKGKLPKALVIGFIKVKSGLLQPTITATLLKLGTHHLDLHMKAHHKAVQKKRVVEDNMFIPCSAGIKFILMVSKEAEEDQ
eukprot:13937764-Ditylum_brightwellii.AAC.1